MDIASASCPTNIAIVKYWGKDVARGRNTPINSSCSLTLDSSDLRAETVIVASASFGPEDALYLNGRLISFETGTWTHAKRLRTCLATMRDLCTKSTHPLPASSKAKSRAELASWRVRIVSRNTFPTAAGLASSAAGYAALVRAAASLYGLCRENDIDLTAIARIGSGSACRSLYGGLVAWRKGKDPSGNDSIAEQFFDETYWPQLRVVVLVANAKEKETPSSEGMALSVETSPFLQFRAENVAEARVDSLRDAFSKRDFGKFAEICMRDSNSFHATCLDTYPPIFYLDATSKAVIKAVHLHNEARGCVEVAYTFDAGPNAVLFCATEEAADRVAAFMATCFLRTSSGRRPTKRACNKPDLLRQALERYPPSKELVARCADARAEVKMVYLTSVGGGAVSPLPQDALDALVDFDGDVVKPRKSPPQDDNNNTVARHSSLSSPLAALLGGGALLALLGLLRRAK